MELGGAQVNTLYTFETLNPSIFETFLLSGDKGLLNKKVKKGDAFFIIPDLIRNIRPLRDVRAFFQIRKKLKTIQPHILHTHSSKAGFLGRLAGHIAKVPVIIHSVHGFSFSPFHSFIKRFIYTSVEKLTAPFTTHFIFVSRQDIRIARKLRLIDTNFSLIRSGFPTTEFEKSEANINEMRDKYNINRDDFVCGIIAPYKPQKGLHHIIEIASIITRKTQKIVFFLAGDGNLRKKLETELQKRNLSQFFRMPGFIHDISSVIDIFDCGLSCALWEGLPQSVVQLRMKKKPVVVSDIPGHREIVIDNRNGFLVKTGDYEKFKEKILLLKQQPETLKKMGEFQDNFDEWNAEFMVHKQQELYLKLLDECD
jgi:glycosyltransferase involved in cell wall biosynthesis